MIVQAKDGHYYKNPTIEFDGWALEVNADGSFVKRKGMITWATARKYIPDTGVKCRYEGTISPSTAIIQGVIEKCSVFRVSLHGPIPIPTTHNGKLILKPTSADLDHADEALLAWQ